ncbi:metal-dependent hydrolase [Anaeromicropila populeti]|uniref:LexA-binding, inner membrane-associated putative hydrolase n=1 Tax=Anaeromicropila populeti TaxID=37658 RepID=A0A1I6LWW2_9FIRM|nr:metal-dependent hydrolase [Anaeromicropila populeti]SFS07895.1 LexA-binding, inner membrane-associated putative hydrolase [Anaeromicropila populeti]
MMGITHRCGAVLAALATIEIMSVCKVHIGIPEMAALATGSIFGGYLPDIDTPNSHISRKLGIILWPVWILRIFIRIIRKIVPGTSKVGQQISKAVGHRGMAHAPVTWIIVGTVYWLLYGQASTITSKISILNGGFPFLLGIGIAVGIVSHLLLDMISGGIPLFFPVTLRRIKLLTMKTGGYEEWIVRIGLLITIIIITYKISISGGVIL